MYLFTILYCLFADSILSAVDVRVLHGGVRRVGVAGGAVLPDMPVVE